MAKVLITGGNGVLGSSLSEMLLKMGDEVIVTDITRVDECWRLIEKGILDQIEYKWKASQDLSYMDLKGIDLVIDCAIGFPDRPFGNESPRAAIKANTDPAVGLLECIRKLSEPPAIIYPSSFNALYGNHGSYDENTYVNPTSIYGWTKAAVEQLYRTYHYSFNIPIMITRVGSSYGEMMRTDELIAKLIISNLQSHEFSLRSPHSKRLWTYLGDVVGLYETIVKRSDYGHNADFLNIIETKNSVINVGGNLGDQILSNVEVCKLIGEVMDSDLQITLEDYYEPGEMIKDRPVEFTVDPSWSRKLLGRAPEYTLRDGFKRTAEWFTDRYNRVSLWNTS